MLLAGFCEHNGTPLPHPSAWDESENSIMKPCAQVIKLLKWWIKLQGNYYAIFGKYVQILKLFATRSNTVNLVIKQIKIQIQI
jgi:hypothetical protein